VFLAGELSPILRAIEPEDQLLGYKKLQLDLPNASLAPALEFPGCVLQEQIHALERISDVVWATPTTLNRVQVTRYLEPKILSQLDTIIPLECQDMPLLKHYKTRGSFLFSRIKEKSIQSVSSWEVKCCIQ